MCFIVVSVPQLVQQAIEGETKLGLAIAPYIEQDITGIDSLLYLKLASINI